MVDSDTVLQLACAVLVLGLPLCAVLVERPARSSLLPVLGAAALAVLAVPVWAAVLGLPDDGPARVLDAALVGGVAVAVGLVSARRLGGAGAAVLVGLGAAGAIAPQLLLTVGVTPSPVQRILGAVDAGGVLATHVAVATLLLIGSGVAADHRFLRARSEERPPRRATTLALALITVSATGWMLGAERLVSDASGRIALNAGLGALLGAAVWMVIAVLVGRERPAHGPVLGALLGWGAVGAGAPFLSPMAVGAAVVLGVAAGAGIVLRRRAGASATVRVAMAMIVAVVVGGVVAGLLADGFGLAATGSISAVAAHLIAVVVTMALTAPVAAIAAGVALVATRRPFRWAIPDSN